MQDVNPFVHNSLLKQPDEAAVENLLVAGESAVFKLTMQNPYEIEVDVESAVVDVEVAVVAVVDVVDWIVLVVVVASWPTATEAT